MATAAGTASANEAMAARQDPAWKTTSDGAGWRRMDIFCCTNGCNKFEDRIDINRYTIWLFNIAMENPL